MTIVKIHGASGAGKTTAVRELMALALRVDPIQACGAPGRPLKTVGHILTIPGLDRQVAVLGSYTGANCGGVDTVGSAKEVMDMIDAHAKDYHVVHEGLLQSTYYGLMGEHSEGFENYIYAFLTTPLAVCQGRVIMRREANKTTRAYDPQKNVDKYHVIWRLHDRLAVDGTKVVELFYNEPMGPQLFNLLCG